MMVMVFRRGALKRKRDAGDRPGRCYKFIYTSAHPETSQPSDPPSEPESSELSDSAATVSPSSCGKPVSMFRRRISASTKWPTPLPPSPGTCVSSASPCVPKSFSSARAFAPFIALACCGS